MRVVSPEYMTVLREAEFLSTRQAHLVFACFSPSKLRLMCDRGELRFSRIDGGHYCIEAASIRERLRPPCEPDAPEEPERKWTMADVIAAADRDLERAGSLG